MNEIEQAKEHGVYELGIKIGLFRLVRIYSRCAWQDASYSQRLTACIEVVGKLHADPASLALGGKHALAMRMVKVLSDPVLVREALDLFEEHRDAIDDGSYNHIAPETLQEGLSD